MAAAACSYDPLEKALSSVLQGLNSLGISKLTKEQRQALFLFSKGKDTFAVLPTGHGKSLIYQMAVLLAKEMNRDRPVIIVISPLKSLIADQIRECGRFGLSSCKLEAENVESLKKECNFDIIFASPEVFESFAAKCFLQLLSKRIIGIVVDESHCVVKWGMQGEPFRAAYGKIGQLRSFVHCPLLCLTATAGKETRTQIMKALHMRDTKLIKISPDKPNCKFVVKKCPEEVEDELRWVLMELKENKFSFPRTIIYCRSLSSYGQLYSFFQQELDDSLRSTYAMYHSKTPEEIQRKVLESIVDPSGMVRLVFATSALGMGVNLPNIRRIIHLGIPRDMEEYLQEVGRGGRDGGGFEALMLYKPYHLAVCETDMKAFVKNPNIECRRKLIMEAFKEKVNDQGSNLECCDVCASRGETGDATVIDMSTSLSVADNTALQSVVSRTVDEEDRTFLREMLLEHVYRDNITSVFGIGELVSSIDKETVEQIVANCNYIFDIKYLMGKFPILSVALATEVLSIVNEVFGDVQEVAETSKMVVEDWDYDPLMVNVSDWCTHHDGDDDDDDDSDAALYS